MVSDKRYRYLSGCRARHSAAVWSYIYKLGLPMSAMGVGGKVNIGREVGNLLHSPSRRKPRTGGQTLRCTAGKNRSDI